MVLYEGLDYPPSSKKEIKRFSSMNDVISPVKASERVFLIQLHPGSMINFTFRTLPYWKTSSPGSSSNWTGIIACAAAAVAALYIRYLARFKPRSQQNDANVAVLTVQLVPSQPNEGDLPPSYEEAAQQNDANLAVQTVHLVPSQPNERDLPPSYEEAAQ
uniref:Uncharacterized protein n=1 Tax=Plectus sambesii TaxID=2011161 RepID=A0A914W4P5_9BILA